MANAILFIGWNRPHTGLDEVKTYGWLMNEAIPSLKKHEGKYFERMEPFALTAHGGDMNGGIMLFGERAKLDELRRTDEFETFSMQMSRHFANLGVVPGVSWEGLQHVMKRQHKS